MVSLHDRRLLGASRPAGEVLGAVLGDVDDVFESDPQLALDVDL
jgi:hypothetical protein